jgi:hypothetical protein
VYFTRTGQIDSTVGMTSFPLPTGKGKVFNLKVWNPDQLPLVSKKRPRRGHVDFRFDTNLPAAVILAASWVPMVDALREIPSTTPMTEPFVNLPQYGNRRMFLARQPRGYPLRSHLLMLTATRGEVADEKDLRMFFAAGYDPTKAAESPMIGALFPWHPSEEDAARLPSADKKFPESPEEGAA